MVTTLITLLAQIGPHHHKCSYSLLACVYYTIIYFYYEIAFIDLYVHSII